MDYDTEPGKESPAEQTLAEDSAGQRQDMALVPFDDKRANRFYSVLRKRITTWLDGQTRASDKVKQYLLLLPDLFALLLRLLRDPRVPSALKRQLIPAILYVMSPIDLVPDFLMPVGLVDDAVAIAFILSQVANIMGQTGEDILRQHWEGEEDILLAIRRMALNANAVLRPEVVRRLQKRFRGGQKPTGN